ncbi:hypothetical protein ABVK25_001307 [Lepraria finkii]|uniref:Uncharacterized protein n=1 Tax=Lepraria finkii TaxID=1340010 RepID=A0ABR4BP95_9LECA
MAPGTTEGDDFDTMIPLLLASLGNIHPNFKTMAALDKYKRTESSFQQRFRNWKKKAPEPLNANPDVGTASATAPLKPRALPKKTGKGKGKAMLGDDEESSEWEKFEPQSGDTADQPELKKLAEDDAIKENFTKTLEKMEDYKHLTEEQKQNVKSTQMAAMLAAKEKKDNEAEKEDKEVAEFAEDATGKKRGGSNKKGIAQPVKNSKKADEFRDDTDEDDGKGGNEDDIVVPDEEEQPKPKPKPKPKPRTTRKPRGPAAQKAKGKRMPTVPDIKEQPMKKWKADALAIKASRKAAEKEADTENMDFDMGGDVGIALAGDREGNGNQPREEDA